VLRHEARLAVKEKDGSTRRAHLEHAAKRGVATAMAALTPPPYPDAVAYLEDWTWQVHGRSGVSMDGLAPLSYGTVADWAALTGRDPTPEEVEALMQLDVVLRFPDAGEEA
jgi:hypothetical protein